MFSSLWVSTGLDLCFMLFYSYSQQLVGVHWFYNVLKGLSHNKLSNSGLDFYVFKFQPFYTTEFENGFIFDVLNFLLLL